MPKSMANIAGRPFLGLLLHQLQRHGFERVILAVGYGMDIIRSHFGERSCGLLLQYSPERSPLGTGGALRNAADKIESTSALVTNGDSYTDADLREFAQEHLATGADVSVMVVPADGRNDCGLVSLESDGTVSGFKEKQGSSAAKYLNSGIYVAKASLLREIPNDRKISLELELMPEWLAQGRYVRGFVANSECTDIGTPERFEAAQAILESVETNGAAS